jgi:hypothetical protein
LEGNLPFGLKCLLGSTAAVGVVLPPAANVALVVMPITMAVIVAQAILLKFTTILLWLLLFLDVVFDYCKKRQRNTLAHSIRVNIDSSQSSNKPRAYLTKVDFCSKLFF